MRWRAGPSTSYCAGRDLLVRQRFFSACDGRNNGPAVIFEASSRARTAFTGQASEPDAIAMVWPAPSWSAHAALAEFQIAHVEADL
jgi:hypothetical protein